MKILKNCLLIISCSLCLLGGISVYSEDAGYHNTGMEADNMKDYSKELESYLKNKSKNFPNPYSFFVQKKQNHYVISVENQGKKYTADVSQEDVNKLIVNEDKNVEKAIFNVVFIPGKK